MKKDIFEASELPENEKVYLKKGSMGYRVVHPDKVWLGGRKNMLNLIIYIIIGLIIYGGINELIGNYKEIADNPCAYCNDCHSQTREVLGDLDLKLKRYDFERNISKEIIEFEGGENG